MNNAILSTIIIIVLVQVTLGTAERRKQPWAQCNSDRAVLKINTHTLSGISVRNILDFFMDSNQHLQDCDLSSIIMAVGCENSSSCDSKRVSRAA